MDLFETFEHKINYGIYEKLYVYNQLIIKPKFQMEFNNGVCKVTIPKFFKNEEYEMIKKLAELGHRYAVCRKILEKIILNPDFENFEKITDYRNDNSTVTAIITFFGENYNESIWMLFDCNDNYEYNEKFNVESFVELFYWYYENGYFEKDIVISKVRLIERIFNGINYLIKNYEYVYTKLLGLFLKCEHNKDLIISFLLNLQRLPVFCRESFYSSEIMNDDVMIDILLYIRFPIDMRCLSKSSKMFKILNEKGNLEKYLKYRKIYSNEKHVKRKILIKLIKYGSPYLKIDYFDSNFFDSSNCNFKKIKEKNYTKYLIDFLKKNTFPMYRTRYIGILLEA